MLSDFVPIGKAGVLEKFLVPHHKRVLFEIQNRTRQRELVQESYQFLRVFSRESDKES
jgi:hypothetical protein